MNHGRVGLRVGLSVPGSEDPRIRHPWWVLGFVQERIQTQDSRDFKVKMIY